MIRADRKIQKLQPHKRHFFLSPLNLIVWAIVLWLSGCQESSSSSYDVNGANTDRLGDLYGDEVPYPNQEVNLRGRYAGVAKNLYTEQVYRETANDRISALQRAINNCRQFAFQEAGCVGIRTYSTALLPSSYGEGFGSWNCFAETNHIAGDPTRARSWMGAGKTQKEAEKSALDRCRLRSGVICRIVRCFNDDFDKIP